MAKAAIIETPMNWLWDVVYPPKCALCQAIGEPPICAECRADFCPANSFFLAGLDSSTALYRYTGRAAQAVRRLKYSRSTSLAESMARMLAAAQVPPTDMVIPVPIHWSRRFLRGFNQAELLAACMNPYPSALVRWKRTRPQVGLSRDRRLTNLAGAFLASEAVKGRTILLVDDVTTSGGTASACAHALRTAGATEVHFLSFCEGTQTGDPTN